MSDSKKDILKSKIFKYGEFFKNKFKNNFLFTLGSLILIISGLTDINSGTSSFTQRRGSGGQATFSRQFDVNAFNTSKLINSLAFTKIGVGLLLLSKKKD
tara:strand:- start:102 stop:401 length:300 start_codon:yes stop_codon:yes gene_type:complete